MDPKEMDELIRKKQKKKELKQQGIVLVVVGAIFLILSPKSWLLLVLGGILVGGAIKNFLEAGKIKWEEPTKGENS